MHDEQVMRRKAGIAEQNTLQSCRIKKDAPIAPSASSLAFLEWSFDPPVTLASELLASTPVTKQSVEGFDQNQQSGLPPPRSPTHLHVAASRPLAFLPPQKSMPRLSRFQLSMVSFCLRPGSVYLAESVDRVSCPSPRDLRPRPPRGYDVTYHSPPSLHPALILVSETLISDPRDMRPDQQQRDLRACRWRRECGIVP